MLANKQVLISDPIVKNMNETQWLFEFEGMRFAEEQKVEEYKALISFIKKGVVSILGLDLLPVEESVESSIDGETITRYRRPNDNEILPLTIYLGQEGILSEVAKRHQELEEQEKAEIASTQETSSGEFVSHQLTPEELDDLIGLDPDAESDITFPVGSEEARKQAIWNSPATKSYLTNGLMDIRDKDKDLDEFDIIEGPKTEVKVQIDE